MALPERVRSPPFVLRYDPDVVTIDYGLNDRGIGFERAREAGSSMIKPAQTEGVKVILLTPTGIRVRGLTARPIR